MEILLGICLGIGLSAACGFRVFLPMLSMCIASKAGWLTLGEGFEWIGSWPALITFGVATAFEIGAYYVPWLDNLLDAITAPAAVIAGTIVAAAAFSDGQMNPLLLWAAALIAGGGTAAVVKGGTITVRGTSTLTTAGTTNFIVSTFELVASFVLSILAILMPVVAAVLVVFVVFLCGRFILKRFARRPATPSE